MLIFLINPDENYMFLAPDNAVVVGVKTARNAIEEELEETDEEETEEGATEEEGGGAAPAKEESTDKSYNSDDFRAFTSGNPDVSLNSSEEFQDLKL